MIEFTEKIAWSDRAKVPPVPAVYAFVSAPETLLYIGSSRNLRARMTAHHRQKMLADNDEIRWIEENEAQIRSLEEELIKQYSPPWNGVVIPPDLQAWDLRPISVKLSDAEK